MIKGFIGDIGGGKTASMVREAYIQHIVTGKKIISNMHLNFDHTYITYEDFLHMIETGEGLNDCILLLDEIHIWLDARTSASKRNRVISYFALQTRKADVDLYYTTQYIIQVDVRIRNLTTHLVECYTQEQPITGIMITLNVVNIRKINKMVTKKYMFQTQYVFNLYDTKEIISM